MTSTAEPATRLLSDLYIGGRFVEPSARQRFDTLNPATGAVLASVAQAQAEDVGRAVEAAHAAYEGVWAQMPMAERGAILRRVATLLRERAEWIGEIETLDGGKPIRETVPRVGKTADWWDFFADIAQKMRSFVVPTDPGLLNYTLRQPRGVVGVIIPWNYPISTCALKIPAALAVGNTVVLKPAELAPLSPLALASLCEEAGLPPGVLNVVPGYGAEAGRALVAHERVRMIAFTGSTKVGREIAATAGGRLVPAVLELGGKSPNVVFADADLDQAARTSLFSFTHNQGQICTAGTRLLVEESAQDEFLERLVAHAAATRIGDPMDKSTDVGAVVSAAQLDRIEGYVEQGHNGGAHMACGGARPRIDGHEDGFFYTPTVFTGVTNDMTIAQEEIFGPVVSVIPFTDEAEAVALANDILYGLAAAVWTSDSARSLRMAERMEAGVVWVNTMHQLAPSSPFGGWKGSGLGAVGGIEQAESYSRLKSVWVNVDSQPPGF
jgi:acyl-CoA reductase-like NAD-dependent aldehyde dehydrogenase